MKKLLFSLLALAAVSCAFVSCKDDEMDLGPTNTTAPTTVAVGNYSGTWTVYDSDGVTVLETHNGSMTISEGSNNTLANISTAAPGFTTLDGATSVVNLAWANENVTVVNASTSNGFKKFAEVSAKASAGTGLSGLVENGTLVMKFSLTVKSGRSTNTMFYEFKGAK